MKRNFVFIIVLIFCFPFITFGQLYTTPNGVFYNADFIFGGTLILEDLGAYVAKITTTGVTAVYGQLSFPIPPGADPTKLIIFKDGLAIPNIVLQGNNNNVYIYIGHPPGLIDGIYAFTRDASLPVELSAFTLKSTEYGVLCKWTTDSEFENIGFIIERKKESGNWIELECYKNDPTLLGQGTISAQTHYKFLDTNVSLGCTYQYRLVDIDYNGVMTIHEPVGITYETEPVLGSGILNDLYVYPNPFNHNSTITFSLNKNEYVSVSIYDMNGKPINTLIDSEKDKGWHSIVWNGKNENGEYVPTGVYIYKTIVGDEIRTKKIMLLK